MLKFGGNTVTTSVFREFFYNEMLDFKNLNSDTIVIFDTNTLLNIYRYSNDTRNKLITAIKSIQSNIWMPYQVGLEFNLNRRNVISILNKEKEIRKTEIDNAINESVKPLKNTVRAVSLKSTDAISCKNEIIEFLEEKTATLKNELQKKIDELYEMLDLSEDLASEIARIYEGRIGVCYTQNQLDTKLLDAGERYDNKIPPGYKDASKVEVTNYNGIKFEKKYGDLIVWHQILDKASDENIKKVVLVTDDNKEDWWYKSSGETIGPRAELKNELLRIANADLYMLNANSFLNNFTSAEDVKDLISTESFVEDKDEKTLTVLERLQRAKSNADKKFNITIKESMAISEESKAYKGDSLLLKFRNLQNKIEFLEENLIDLLNEINNISSRIHIMEDDNPVKIELQTYLRKLIRDRYEIEMQLSSLKSEKEKVLYEYNRF